MTYILTLHQSNIEIKQNNCLSIKTINPSIRRVKFNEKGVFLKVTYRLVEDKVILRNVFDLNLSRTQQFSDYFTAWLSLDMEICSLVTVTKEWLTEFSRKQKNEIKEENQNSNIMSSSETNLRRNGRVNQMHQDAKIFRIWK